MLIGIYFGIVIAALAAWYAAFAQVNRRRAQRVLRRVERAFAGHGKLAGVHHMGPGQIHVQLQLAPNNWFHSASVALRLQPLELPLRWIAERMRREPEVLIFEADLDVAPAHALEVHRHRWVGRTRGSAKRAVDTNAGERCQPILFTTKQTW